MFKSKILDLLQAGKSFALVSNAFLYSMLFLLQWVVDVLLLEIVRDAQTNVRLDVQLRFIGQRLVAWKNPNEGYIILSLLYYKNN